MRSLKINPKDFLHYVAVGQQYEAENLLKQNEVLAQELLMARDIEFTDYSSRTFKCSAYEYAWWAKDSHMRFMLEKYMSNETKQELLKRVQYIEEYIEVGLYKGQRGLLFIQKEREYRSAHFDLTPLKRALNKYIEAFNNSPKRNEADWQKLERIWKHVGLAQREVPAHIAHEYCNTKCSFADLVKKQDLLDASNPNNLNRTLSIRESYSSRVYYWFAPGDSVAYCRGSANKVTIVGAPRRAAHIDLKAINAIDEARTKELNCSLEHLAAQSDLHSPNPPR